MRYRRTLVAALAVLAPLAALAIEPSSGVKVQEVLKTSTSWDGAPLSYPQGQAQVTGLVIEVAPGAQTGWHDHPVPSFGMLLEGTLEVTLADGRTKRIQAGEALAEVINTPHNSRNIGNSQVKLVVFYAGAADQPVTRPLPGPRPKNK